MKLTIFTPTYNRGSTLQRLYESLLLQTRFDFEWLIIDDGSTDNTEEIIKTFYLQDKFPIVFHQKKNGGKHTAYNTALTLAKGDFFFCVDSDDRLKEDAIEKLLAILPQIKKHQFIMAYKIDQNGKLLSDTFPKNCTETTLTQLNFKFKCCGEFSLIFPTNLAQQFQFPIFKGEQFITESVIYDRIDKIATALLFPQILTVCEYQPDGLSNSINSTMKKNPAGYCLYFMQRIDMQPSLKDKIITAGKYNCFKVFAKKQKSNYTGNYKTLVFLTIPLGILFWIYYKIFRKF